MTDITYKFEKDRVYVDNTIDGCENAIAKIDGRIIFTDGEYTSISALSVYLGCPDKDTFIPTENVTDEQLGEWAIEAAGGGNYINEIYEYHSKDIENKRREKTLELYYGNQISAFPMPIDIPNWGDISNTEIEMFEAPTLD